ncbi:hypothetical protein PINS_up008266 [Pythium insidiosum]|nr:hypothetical protein PINS_up008266 [Pythium insidiosum]
MSPSHAQAALQARLNRRRSSSKPWNGMTFTSTLGRWTEFEGQLLGEDDASSDAGDEEKGEAAEKLSESSSEAGDTTNSNNPFAPPSKSAVEKYKRMNPTLFRWTRYTPYLGPYADCDVFRTHDSAQAGWLIKLTHDGEFFASFMAAYCGHAELVSNGEPLWACLPGYSLLIRLSLLLVKEAAWQKWFMLRDASENTAPRSAPVGQNQDQGDGTYFDLKSIRAVKTVLDNVIYLLRNRDVLESCVLAMFECTNVLNSKSVGACLSRFEEWFAAAAIPMSNLVGNLSCSTPEAAESAHDGIVYRLPPNFQGYALSTGIRIMLCSESFEILNRALLFLYNRMDYFDGELRQSVLKAVVQRHMFLFLHWNEDVRANYHHLLIYKIVRVNRFLLDSPIDQLLIGRLAMIPIDMGSKSGDNGPSAIGFDDSDGPYDEAGPRPVLSAAEFNTLRLEQALWRAFDACLAAICVQERKHAREGNRKYQAELQAARCRAIAFQHLTRKTVGDDDSESNMLNEGLPGGKPSHELDLLNDELRREPPYYLRYLPAEEVSSLDELRRLAQTMKYPADLQIYAASSLRHYSDLLKQYFKELRQNGVVEAPPLGFC